MNKKNKQDIAIELKNVSKKYIIHHEKPTLAERILHGKNREFIAINNLSLTIKKGERVGLIGPNGSGKTTLLKLITGITSPTSGKVKTNGKVVSLIDLEAGFHPDLTGIQNIYLNGIILGIKREEIDQKMKDIISFADINKFIDAPLFTYSSGMKLRLGFSIAIYSDPEILILDENISVGDQEFFKKTHSKIQQLFRQQKTVIIASHNMDLFKIYCNKVYSMQKGTIIEYGPTKKVIKNYLKSKH